MKALMRRGPYQGEVKMLKVGDLVLDLEEHSVRRGRRAIALTAKEFQLLTYLMRNVGYSFEPGTKVVDVYIRYLRKKIDEGEDRPLIHTVRGFGYRLAHDSVTNAGLT